MQKFGATMSQYVTLFPHTSYMCMHIYIYILYICICIYTHNDMRACGGVATTTSLPCLQWKDYDAVRRSLDALLA